MNMRDIPYRFRWVTCLSQRDTGYLETMWSTMQGNTFDIIVDLLTGLMLQDKLLQQDV